MAMQTVATAAALDDVQPKQPQHQAYGDHQNRYVCQLSIRYQGCSKFCHVRRIGPVDEH